MIRTWSETVQITVNGQNETLDESATVSDLLARFELAPLRVAIEVNEQLVRRADYGETTLRAGDRVEIVTLVGGG